MVSNRSLAAAGGLALVALPGVAVAGSTTGAEPGLVPRLAVRFVVAFAVNLVLGGTLLILGPEYATDRISDVDEDPGGTFVWGLAIAIGGPVVMFLLAITVVGLIVAIPAAVVLAILGLVGNAVTVLWLGGLAAGTPDSPDLVAVGAGALLLSIAGAIPVLGNLLVSLVTAVGLGAVGRHLYRTRNDRPSSGVTPRNRRSSHPRR